MYRVAGLPVFVVAVHQYNFTLCRAINSYNHNMTIEERKLWHIKNTNENTRGSCQKHIPRLIVSKFIFFVCYNKG